MFVFTKANFCHKNLVMLLEKKNGSTNKQFWSSVDAGTWRLRLVADSSTQDVQTSQHHQNQPDHYQQKNQQEQQPQQRSTSSSSTIVSSSHQTSQQQTTTFSTSSSTTISTSISSFLLKVVSSQQELPKVGVRSPRSTTLTLGWWTWTTSRWLDNILRRQP